MKTLSTDTSKSKSLLVILGNQLFDLKAAQTDLENIDYVFMREDQELCTYYKFHKHKIIFFLAAMRTFAQELTSKKIAVHYEKLAPDSGSYEKSLETFITSKKITSVSIFEIEDKFFETRLMKLFSRLKLNVTVLPSPMFLTGRTEFKNYLGKTKKPFMKTFYEQQRKRLKILVDKNDQPVGGQWSFDVDNRLALPDKIVPPDVPLVRTSDITWDVIKITDELFSKHPGQSQNFWLPVDRKGAKAWLKRFLDDRLLQFGPYEDAIPQHSDFVFHSVLTPFLNTGLLTPSEVVQETLAYAKDNKIPIASTEGFIRQVIGWREFIRGIYQNYSEKQESTNFFKHNRKLTDHWYKGNTGVAPLDHAIRKTVRYGYAHHIERLMIIGSLMLLLEVDPTEAHKWFMEMFIDSSDWVMGPNVYGMALFADGGIFATKPYFCGSNYYRKMGGYKASEPWCDGVDGLYWGFIEKHKAFFLKNPRLSMMARTVEKMDSKKKKTIFAAAEKLKSTITK
tara:strand:+ start:55217 stop:56740 length:1524 start_codon:yes stop_codon:yes gene_type:complete